jgi:hypothetical protein
VTSGCLASASGNMATQYPEARVLIIMTGGTICMRHSPEGLIPARGFLAEGMSPRPSFNDGSKPGMFDLLQCLRIIPVLGWISTCGDRTIAHGASLGSPSSLLRRSPAVHGVECRLILPGILSGLTFCIRRRWTR